MIIKELPSITIIGKEGLCTKENNIVSSLWDEANKHFDEVAPLAKRDENGHFTGFYGAMSDVDMNYLPWSDDFTTGLYLAGVEVEAKTKKVEGWKIWVLPKRKYLIEEVTNDTYSHVFSTTIEKTIPSMHLQLSGAVCDFTNPVTQQNYLYFPVKEIDDYRIIDLKEIPDLKDEAANWFHEKWHVPKVAYEKCMNDYLDGNTKLGWYLCLDQERIIGGLGVIDNDFHERTDLAPNVCAVYVEKEYRNQRIAGKLLNFVVEDCKKKGITPLYLVTDHTSFYERYNWKYVCDTLCDGGEISRIYMHD